MWYKNSGNDNDVVLSSRVRLARNLSEYPFAEKLTKEQAEEIINKVKSIYSENDGWTATDMESLDEAHRGALVDKHLISDEFSRKKGPAYFIENDERGVYIMVLKRIISAFSLLLPDLTLRKLPTPYMQPMICSTKARMLRLVKSSAISPTARQTSVRV